MQLQEFINRRNLTEFGNMALVERREELEGGNVAIGLPGVQKGDMASRNFKPKIKIFALRFMPTGQAFAVATTEGLCIYSLDKGMIKRIHNTCFFFFFFLTTINNVILFCRCCFRSIPSINGGDTKSHT